MEIKPSSHSSWIENGRMVSCEVEASQIQSENSMISLGDGKRQKGIEGKRCLKSKLF